MTKSTIAILVYILGLIFSAFVLNMWSAETGPEAFMGIAWTTILLVTLLYTSKYEKE